MTSSHNNRRIAGVIAAALALGAAGPAGALPVGSDAPVAVAPPAHAQQYGRANVLPPFSGLHVTRAGEVPFVPRHVKGFPEATAAPVPTTTPRAVVTHPGTAGGSDLAYILVGGGIAVAVTGMGGALAVSRRRTARTAAPARPKIAA
jgi:hypothetical protein